MGLTAYKIRDGHGRPRWPGRSVSGRPFIRERIHYLRDAFGESLISLIPTRNNSFHVALGAHFLE
jgi:hypothetical protein